MIDMETTALSCIAYSSVAFTITLPVVPKCFQFAVTLPPAKANRSIKTTWRQNGLGYNTHEQWQSNGLVVGKCR